MDKQEKNLEIMAQQQILTEIICEKAFIKKEIEAKQNALEKLEIEEHKAVDKMDRLQKIQPID